MFGLSTLASSLTQGGMFGGGEESENLAVPISSSSTISGPVSFSTGGMNVNQQKTDSIPLLSKTDSTPLLIFAGVAGLVLLVVLSRKKH